jgi:hypothetical protein
MSTIKGTCETFLAGIEDATKKCKPMLLNTTVNSFVDFIFVSGDRTLTFSGNDQQIKPDDDTAVQPINRVIYFDGIGKVERRAVGSCAYHNPYAGASKIVCTAMVEGGDEYKGVFNTDGNVPETISPK